MSYLITTGMRILNILYSLEPICYTALSPTSEFHRARNSLVSYGYWQLTAARYLLRGAPVLFQPLQHRSCHGQKTTARPPRRRCRGSTAASTTFGEQGGDDVSIADCVHLEEPTRAHSGVEPGEEGVDQPSQLKPCTKSNNFQRLAKRGGRGEAMQDTNKWVAEGLKG